MKRHLGKAASIATSVVAAFLAAAPGSSPASPPGAPDQSEVSGGETVSPAALDAIRSKAAQLKVAETVKPVVAPFHRTYFGKFPQAPFIQSHPFIRAH